MAIFQLNNTQADTMTRAANASILIVAVLGVGIDDDKELAIKLGEFAQDVFDLVGLGLLEAWDSERGKEIAKQLAEEGKRSVQIYTISNVGKLMFRNTEDRVAN